MIKKLVYIIAAVVICLVAFNMVRSHYSNQPHKIAPEPQVDTTVHKSEALKPEETLNPAAHDPKNLELVQHYTDEINKVSTDATNYYLRALTYHKMQQYSAAIQDFDAAIKITPGSANAFFGRGLTYYAQKAFDKAADDFSQAIKLTPKDPHIYNARGVVYVDQNKADLAISDFNQAITIDPTYGSAYFNRGTAYEQQKNSKLALESYSKAIENNKAEVDQEDPAAVTHRLIEAYYRRAIVELDLNDANAALKDINLVIEQDPKSGKAFKLRSAINEKLGNTAAAISDQSTADTLSIESMMK